MRKRLLKTIPYLVVLIVGALFYLLSKKLSQGFRDIFINISAAFFAIPLLYFFYEIVKAFSHKRLNKKIFDYAKMQIDREILSILNQLQKIIYTLEGRDFSDKGIIKLLSLRKREIRKQIKINKYLGFQVFKKWEVSEKGLHEILKNPFILEKLEDELIISVIDILKSIRHLEFIQKRDDLYIDTKEKAQDYRIQSGLEINPDNNKFPERYLLLKQLNKDKFVVYDFGDIPKYNLDKSLNYFIVNSELLETYSEIIFELITNINRWLDLTGKEFIIDTKIFRMVDRYETHSELGNKRD